MLRSVSLCGCLFRAEMPFESGRFFVQSVMRSRRQNDSILICNLVPCCRGALRRLTLTITKVVLLLDYLIGLSDLYVFAVAFTSPGAFDIVKLWASSWAFS